MARLRLFGAKQTRGGISCALTLRFETNRPTSEVNDSAHAAFFEVHANQPAASPTCWCAATQQILELGVPMKIKSIAVAATTLFAMAAYAQAPANPTATPRVDKREARQEVRIEQGKSTGALTEKESARLEKGQTRVQTAEEKAKADGTVTDKERAKLTHMQNKQSRHIAKEKHDKQTTTPAPQSK
jgi:hypothetical protein